MTLMTNPTGCPRITTATHFTVRTAASLRGILLLLVLFAESVPTQATEVPSRMARGYLALLENFAGWCEEHWNESDGAFDAAGAGVTWPRGNGGVCIS
jgi:hypothetical protein